MNLREILSEEEFKNLETVAYNKSKPFCYGCYMEVKEVYCEKCHSDDNMRLVDGVGVEYGIEWVIEHLISENCAPVAEDYAENSLRELYGETMQVGWITVDPLDAIKTLDPISFRIALDEYMDGFRSDGEIVEVDGDDFWKDDIIKFIEGNLELVEVA